MVPRLSEIRPDLQYVFSNSHQKTFDKRVRFKDPYDTVKTFLFSSDSKRCINRHNNNDDDDDNQWLGFEIVSLTSISTNLFRSNNGPESVRCKYLIHSSSPTRQQCQSFLHQLHFRLSSYHHSDKIDVLFSQSTTVLGTGRRVRQTHPIRNSVNH